MRSLLALSAFLALALQGCSADQHDLVTAPVTREGISQSVTATGTLSPQDTILVGSQDSGTIAALYVDYNSQVRVGQVLARLDPSTFAASLAQAEANLAQLEAESETAASAVTSSQLTSSAAHVTAVSQQRQIAAADESVRKARSGLDLAQLTLRRDRSLLRQGYVALNVVDSDVANEAAAHNEFVAAQTAASTARLTSAAGIYQAGSTAAQAAGAQSAQTASGAAIAAARAAVAQAQINLNHATITSPVDGTVIQRNVSVGQTVAAALAAPTLFTIAKDLGKMELDIAVGEPDVGAVHAGQRVTFSVLAYPGRTFTTTVREVRQNPTVVNNVTTYDTVAYPSNRDGALRSGMTANVRITSATYPDELVVPLAALQWRPTSTIQKKYHLMTPAPNATAKAQQKRSIWGATGGSTEFAVSVGGEGHLYVLEGSQLRGVAVKIRAMEGTRVGVSPVSGTLAAGDLVVTDDAHR